MADNGTTIAKAYVQILPSTKDMKANLSSELNGDLEQAGKSGGQIWASALGKVATGALGLITTSVATAGVAIVGLTKSSIEQYANYEQLIGGLDTMFEDLSWDIEQYANNAFKTAGLSANDYMETVMGFSASLTQSLLDSEGHIGRSADLANQTVIDMADNANKMGTSMESIQNAYQGFAKQNYTMLDNLKLGYGGTKKEMERLLDKATELSGIEFNIDSFADIVEAIHIVQEDLGITGTTALEASETISGSIASMQSAWDNLVVAMSKDDVDFEKAIQDLVDTIVGVDGKGGVVGNLIPRIQKTLEGVADLIVQLAPQIATYIPEMITTLAPTLLNSIKTLIKTVADNLPTLIKAIIAVLPDLMKTIVDALLELLPVLVDCALELVEALADGLAEAMPELVPPVTEMVMEIADTIINHLDVILECAFKLIDALIQGLIESSPMLMEKGAQLILDFGKSMTDQLLTTYKCGGEIVGNIIDGITNKYPELKDTAKRVIPEFVDQIKNYYNSAMATGADISVNIIQGILDYWTKWLGTSAVTDMIQNLINKIKAQLGFELSQINLSASIPTSVQLFDATSSTSTTSATTSATTNVNVNVNTNSKALTATVNTQNTANSKTGSTLSASRPVVSGHTIYI